jgi:hypothetical protein
VHVKQHRGPCFQHASCEVMHTLAFGSECPCKLQHSTAQPSSY